MSTHNIGFYEDLAKLSSNTHLIASSGGCKNMHDHVMILCISCTVLVN